MIDIIIIYIKINTTPICKWTGGDEWKMHVTANKLKFPFIFSFFRNFIEHDVYDNKKRPKKYTR